MKVELIPPGHDVRFAKQPSQGGVGGNPWIWFNFLNGANPRLIPECDVATLFHLGEFFQESTASAEYGGLTDAALLALLARRTRPGGHLLFYKGSFAFDRAQAAIAAVERDVPIVRVGEFKTLLIYEKK